MATGGTSTAVCPAGDDSQYCVYPGNLQRVGSVRHFLRYSADLQTLLLACENVTDALGKEARAVAVNAIGPDNETLLRAAIKVDHGTRVMKLLAAGADATYEWGGAAPPLEVALQNCSVAAINAIVNWCVAATGNGSAGAASEQPDSIAPDSHPFKHLECGRRVAYSPVSADGLGALADHPHLQLALRQLDSPVVVSAYIAGAAGRVGLLEEILENNTANSSLRRMVYEAWKGAEAFGHLQVLQMLHGCFDDFPSLSLNAGAYAVCYGQLNVLEWLLQDDKFAPGPGHVFDSDFTQEHVVKGWMRIAAGCGNISCIDWLLAQGMPLHESACASAARGGHVGALEVLRDHNCPWSEHTTASAAEGNQLEALKWLRANRCPWDTRVVFEASAHDVLMVQWCLDNGAPVQDGICTAIAARFCSRLLTTLNGLRSIIALQARGHACNSYTLRALLSQEVALTDNEIHSGLRRQIHSSILKRCLSDGVIPTSEHFTLALKAGEYLAAEVMLELDPSLMAPTQALRYFVDANNRMERMASYSFAPMVRWLVRLGAELSPDLFAIAAKPAASRWADLQANMLMLEALHASGCPWDASVTAAIVELACAERSAATLFVTHGGHAGYHLSQLAWLRKHRCPWDRSSCRIAAASSSVRVKQWLIDHRCYCEGELHAVEPRPV